MATIVGLDHELEFCGRVLKGVEYYKGVLIIGKSKSGKSCILKKIHEKHLNPRNEVFFVSLCESNQPYHLISLIYRQIFDANVTTHHLLQFQRNVWDLKEILQEHVLQKPRKERKKLIVEKFCEICALNPKTAVLIDDVQFVDCHSLDVLKAAVERKVLIAIVAGCFQEQESWDILHEFSKSSLFKRIELEGVALALIPELICEFLDVVGVQKKLCDLLINRCEGQPGWIRSCVLKLIKRGDAKVELLAELKGLGRMIFPRLHISDSCSKDDDSRKHVATLTGDDAANSDWTLSGISFDLFNSLNQFERSIIETASVLGRGFSKNALIFMLDHPSVHDLSEAISVLFEEEIFECGSKFFVEGGKSSFKSICVCHASEICPQNCEFLHFRNDQMRSLAYKFLTLDRKKKLHRKAVEFLECQEIRCPDCSQSNCAPIFAAVNFDAFVNCSDENPSADLIRSRMKKAYEDIDDKTRAGTRKLWDPERCFCLEMIARVLGDLERHAEHAGRRNELAFFQYQRGTFLSILDEPEDAVDVLRRASMLCASSSDEVGEKFFKRIFSKICTLLSELYQRLGANRAAKNYAMMSLRQFNISKFATWENDWRSVFTCRAVFNQMYTIQERPDVEHLDPIQQDHHIDLNSVKSIFELVQAMKLTRLLFFRKIKRSVIEEAINEGFSLLDASRAIRGDHLKEEIAPMLAHLLMMRKKIKDAVSLANLVKNSSTDQASNGANMSYYLICTMLIVEGGVYLETVEDIETFAQKHFTPMRDLSELEACFLAYLRSYFTRRNLSKNICRECNFLPGSGFFFILTRLKNLETNLIEFSHGLKDKDASKNLLRRELKEAETSADEWGIFRPRCKHLKAYYMELLHQKGAYALLKRARHEAERVGNVLESCWIRMSFHCWKGGSSFRDRNVLIYWSLAVDYEEFQWSQMMYALPTL